jgi:hypothetical protein
VVADKEMVEGEDDPAEKLTGKKAKVYAAIIEDIFFKFYKTGKKEFEFDRNEIEKSALALGFERPKNLGDIIYTFRYRRMLPKPVLDTQPDGLHWLILGAGDARYRFRLSNLLHIEPTKGLLVRKIPDSTPQIIEQYALTDEQALLAKVRYNRLIDIFLGVTAYSLQNHLRTKIENYGQIEIDELYIALDTAGSQYIVPVQAKGKSDKLGVIQTIQDTIFCQTSAKYKNCVPRTVSAQFIGKSKHEQMIAMFELNFDGNDVSIMREKHYKLVSASDISAADLALYRRGD